MSNLPIERSRLPTKLTLHHVVYLLSVKIPSNTLLNPSPFAAVVGGNVCTSQRVTDVVLKAFGAVAASQGCCNNLTFVR